MITEEELRDLSRQDLCDIIKKISTRAADIIA